MDERQAWLLHHVEEIEWSTPHAFYKILFFIYLFWLHWASAMAQRPPQPWHANLLGVAGMWDLVPQPGAEPQQTLHWEWGIPPTGPPGKSP